MASPPTRAKQRHEGEAQDLEIAMYDAIDTEDGPKLLRLLRRLEGLAAQAANRQTRRDDEHVCGARDGEQSASILRVPVRTPIGDRLSRWD